MPSTTEGVSLQGGHQHSGAEFLGGAGKENPFKPQTMIHIGIDPGQSGGISFIYPEGRMFAHPMPETERDVWELFNTIASESCFAVIERVHSMPGQGVASSFKFGMGYGALRMALVASGIPFEDVTPQKWQKALGCLSGGDKNVTKQRAQSLFPQIKFTHKTADSALIAEYCRRTYP